VCFKSRKKNHSWSYALALRQFESQLFFPDEPVPSIDITGKNPLTPEYALSVAAESKAGGSNISDLGANRIVLLVFVSL